MKSRFPGVRTIDCSTIQLEGKDVIYVKDESDFLYLLGKRKFVFRMGAYYYLLLDRVFIFDDGPRIKEVV
jgi:hypothetical protein